MAKPVIMPKFGMDQTESTLVEWLKHEGDPVEKGEPLAMVETDKVNMEIESPANGILAGIRVQANETVPVTTVIAYIREPDESSAPPESIKPATTPSPTAEPASTTASPQPAAVRPTPLAARLAADAGVDVGSIPGSGPSGRVTKEDVERFVAQQPSGTDVRATPAARRVAREHSVDLLAVTGTGPRGRIQEADVQAAASAAAPSVSERAAPSPEVEVVRLTGIRRTIAQRMQQSVQTIPAFTLTTEIDAGPIQALRGEINAWLSASGQEPVSITALFLKAVAWALGRHPWLNAHCHNEEVHIYHAVHLGVAVDREQGLIVPVIHDADRKSVAQIGAELQALSERARADRLTPEDVQNATFTISNLGMFAVDSFTAIINPPQVGILALGRIAERLVPVNGQPAIRPMTSLTLSADHRVVDGAMGARFLGDLAAVLASPGLLSA